MSGLPSSELIQDIAVELGVDPSFVEKDWYAVQVLKLLSTVTQDQMTLVFSGGTCLSKGYGLLQRFSEDLDFQVYTEASPARGALRSMREDILAPLNAALDLSLKVENLESRNASKFFRCDIKYPDTQLANTALRPHLQLEVSFKAGPVISKTRPIQSFVASFTGEGPETNIQCMSPVVTAADKFNALLWRILTRDKTEEHGSAKNDPAVIRHLHDLSALQELALNDPDFISMVRSTYVADSGRGGKDTELSLADNIEKVQGIFETERDQYHSEYERYVDAMSFASDEERIDFDVALKSFHRISEAVLSD